MHYYKQNVLNVWMSPTSQNDSAMTLFRRCEVIDSLKHVNTIIY